MTETKFEGFSVREATEKDVKGISKITHEAFLAYAKLAGLDTVDALKETEEQIRQDIATKLVLVAFIGDTVVGSVRIAIDGDTAYLSRFGVDTDYQNLGIGKSLINMVDMEMRMLKVKKLQLHTASKVASLMRFYYSRGFYVESTSTDRGYVRALLVKEY